MAKGIGLEVYQELLYPFRRILLNVLNEAVISLILCGSVARAQARRDSDIDLLIILDDAPESYYQRLQPVLDAMRRVKKTSIYQGLERQGYSPYLSFLILSEGEANENRFIFLDMIDDSIILFDREELFEKSLERRLQTLASKKVFLEDGGWYWDVKPDLIPGEVFEL